MKTIVFDTHKFEKPFLEEASKRAGFEFTFIDARLDLKTVELCQGYEAVSIFIHDDASSAVLEKLEEAGVVFLALRSAGYNNVDLSVASKLGIKVANVPEYSPYAIAEHTVALMLALNRKLIRSHNRVMELNFSLDGLVGFDMNKKTAGIIGLGRIGQVVAKILQGFGCRILGFDMHQDSKLSDKYGVEYVSLDKLCRESDIITLHVPLNEKTRYIIDSKRIEMMKKGVMLINTSRGALINTKDAIKGLKSRHIGYLGIDVYEEEEGLFFEDHSAEDMLQDDLISRLMTFRNVIITSHQAFLTQTALENIAQTTIDNLKAWSTGNSSPNEVEV